MSNTSQKWYWVLSEGTWHPMFKHGPFGWTDGGFYDLPYSEAEKVVEIPHPEDLTADA